MPSKKKSSKKTNESPSSAHSAKSSSNIAAVGVVLVVFLLVVAALFSVFQTRLSQEVLGLNDSSKKTRTELLQEINQLKTELTKATEKEETQIKARLARLELASAVDCSDLGSNWRNYIDTDLNWAFCYRDDWGKPTLSSGDNSDKCIEGFSWDIKFSEEDAPTINYQTSDFKNNCEADLSAFCWSCVADLDLTDSPQIRNALNIIDTDDIDVDLFPTASGERGFVIFLDLEDEDGEVYQTASYHIPQLLGKKSINVEITTNGNEDIVDEVVQSIWVGQDS